MEPDYSLECLSETFAEHAVISDKHFVNQVSQFKENYPDEELPSHLKDPYFNLARALSVFAKEIIELKKTSS